MQGILVLGFVCSLLSILPMWGQKTTVPRAKTDGGYWHIKGPNPQRISQYMREVGLTYLEAVEKNYDANRHWGIGLHDSDKLAAESEGEILDMLENRMKINTHAPGDKDFLSVLKFTRVRGANAGLELGLCAHGQMEREDCFKHLAQYVACKDWMKESIDSGIFEDNWHEACYGNWAEEHKNG